jgi:hypothetical protein
VAACGLAMSACTGESSFALPTWDAMAPSSQFEGPCRSWAQALCAYEARCYDPISLQWISSDQCIARETMDCELAASDPAIPFDPVAVAGCQYPTDCAAPPPGLCLPPGRVRVGGSCRWSDECVSGFCVLANAQCGSCQDIPPACDVTCPADQTCAREGDGGTQTCVAIPGIGQACPPPGALVGSISCVHAAACQITGYGPDGTGFGTCVPLASEGQPCSDSNGGPVCFDPSFPLFCDNTQHCRAFRVASYLQPCGVDDAGALYECIGWGSCAYAAMPVCVPPAADGTFCDEQQGLRCLPPARCTGNRCLFPPTTPCTSP